MHPAEKYISDVLSGRIVVCKWVRLAVERHVKDLRDGRARGLTFNPKKASRAIQFFSFLRHSKGEWARTVIKLEPWQQFILWVVFGWRREDGTRRFRTVYEEEARKNGKSTKLAGIGLYLGFMDGEEGAEVYSAATKKDQAIIIHSEAIRMVKSSPDLRAIAEVQKNCIFNEKTGSKFVPIGSDEQTADGLNVHGGLIDEVHAHKTRGMIDVLDSATGSRRQPLLWMITTAGAGRIGVCWEYHLYTENVLQGVIEDDSFFGIIFAIDDDDDWQNEKCWIKANPNLGVSAKLDDLQRKAAKAKKMPSFLNEFLRKHMNRWTDQARRWITMEKWRLCKDPIEDEELRGRDCYAGVDLSSVLDVTAIGYVFPPTDSDRRWRVKVDMFVPAETAETRETMGNVPYQTWGKQGYLHLTEGEAIDYDFIIAKIEQRATVWNIKEIAFDPFNATQTALKFMANNFNVVYVRQGFTSLNAPSKEFERLVVTGDLAHDGNLAFDWMASNVATESDAAGNIKPSKKKSLEKIDGIAAIITALARAIVPAEDNTPGVYAL